MINCIAIDDERLVLELLVDNILQVPYLHLVKSCKNALEAIEVLEKEKTDLIFLDIQMPKLSGIQFLQTLQHPPMVIFITAYEQYALESYNLNVVDYLLKPVSFERFLKACNKAKVLFDLRTDKSPVVKEEADHIFVNVEYTLVKILFDDILFIEGLKDYIKIHLASCSKPVLTKMSLKAMEDKLPADKFIRIHKSFIIAANKISIVKRDLVCIGKDEIPVSDFYKDNLSKIINR